VRFWRWSKRNPKFAAVLAATLLLAVVNVFAAFTISHLRFMIEDARLARQSFTVVRFEDMRELTATLDFITQATNDPTPPSQK
jgi:hypothetical protein